MVKGIEHAAIASPNPEKLAQWYVDNLGFIINYQSKNATFVKAPDGSMIEMIVSEGELARPRQKDPGLRHLALAVDDFENVYARLKAVGATFLTEPVSSKGNQVVFFTDPEGNILHLIQREQPMP
ncbi:MAG: VOC family protein [Bryobacterales bacterium]|nr:VOC family protein [Bryobacterales bacterium]